MTIKRLLEFARKSLAGETAGRLEAEILLRHALDVSRSFLYANPELIVPAARREHFTEMVKRRRQGEPISYITGEREFWSLKLKVTTDVLIPRPETELLVEAAVGLIPPGTAWRLADLGTGSGAVALALATERPGCEVHATEYSPSAMKVAKQNAQRLGLQRVQFHQGSWLEPLRGRFRVIVSNPPYIRQGDPHLQRGDCRYEPQAALVSGPDGLDAIKQITRSAGPFLEPGGWLLLEHGFEQGAEVRAILEGRGYSNVETRLDLAGQERCTIGVLL